MAVGVVGEEGTAVFSPTVCVGPGWENLVEFSAGTEKIFVGESLPKIQFFCLGSQDGK